MEDLLGVIHQLWWFSDAELGISAAPPDCVHGLMDEIRPFTKAGPDLKQLDLHAIFEWPEWQQVPSRSTQHMRWPAEVRLRMTSWYTFHVTFRNNADEALPAGVWERSCSLTTRTLEECVRYQILCSYQGTCRRPQEHVADDDWVSPR